MARKRSEIVLQKLTRGSTVELESMVTELTRDAEFDANNGAGPAHWSGRFVASGKFTLIRPFGKP